jgi:arylsulfatase A-like enzyme
MSDRPNIIYIHSHDTGRWCEPYLDVVPTPNLMAFAKTASVFTNAHTASPTCSPSRGCLLTGTYPHQHGLTGLAHFGFDLEHPEWHLARHLRRQGYRTLLAGVQHERTRPCPTESSEHLGYGDNISADFVNGTTVMEMDRRHAENAAEFLKSDDSGQKPFFLSVGFFNTHRPFRDLPPWEGKLPAELEDTPAARQDFAGYADSLRMLDEAFGIVHEALEGSIHRDNTIVIFTTDHGPPYPDMKCTAHGTGTGVALFIRDRDRETVPSIQSLVSNIDVFPTLCELAGLPLPDYLEGHSLVPLMKGETPSVRDEAFTAINFHVAHDPVRAVRTQDFLLIEAFPPDAERQRVANIDAGPLKQYLLDHARLPQERDALQLYNVRQDPHERHNLAHDPAYETTCERLRKRLHDWMEETDDPLLAGPMPLPAGARQADILSLDGKDIHNLQTAS